MRNEPFPHQKILPVKSLVQSTRQKKQNLFPSNKQTKVPSQNYHTPRSTHSLNSNPQLASRPASPLLRQTDHKQATSLNCTRDDITYVSHHQNSYRGYTPHEQFYFSARPDRYSKQEDSQPGRTMDLTVGHKGEIRPDMTPTKVKYGSKEAWSNAKVALIDRRESFKSVALRRDSGDLERDGSFASSGKVQEETWNISRMQKVMAADRQSQPPFQSEVNKLKTDLFQKQANLFELSQKLDEKQTTIRDLSFRLSLTNEVSRNLSKQGSSQTSRLTAEIERLSQQVAMLSKELSSRKEELYKSEEISSTNNKMLMLKIKQYELEEQERTHYIIELKEKEKKNALNCEKLINGQKQLLRQKEGQLAKVSEAAQFYKEEVSKGIEVVQELNRKIDLKDEVIRELSGQVGDLKDNLKELQQRMREMIDNEDDLKREIQSNQPHEQLHLHIKKLRIELEDKNIQIGLLRKENSQLNHELYEFKEAVREEASVKEFQLSMMQKTCDGYKQRIMEYQRYSRQIGVQMPTKLVQQEVKQLQDSENERIRQRKMDSPTRQKGSPRKSVSPLRESSVESEIRKLKQLNVRLFRDNDKMNSRIRDYSAKLDQLSKTNQGLNDLIVQNQIRDLNRRLKIKISTQ